MKKIYIFLFLLISSLVASQASAHKRLFILLGQSNMSGRAPIEDADMAVCPMVKLLNADGHFEVLRNPLNRFSNIRKDIAMQIAALNPTYMDKSDVSEEFIAKEKEIRLAQAKEDPKNAKKPDAIIEKIVMGGIGKYFKEICLLQQPFVKDDKVSVEDHIAAVAKQIGASIKLVGYTRFEKGEGIEKRQDDLAEEVAKLVK